MDAPQVAKSGYTIFEWGFTGDRRQDGHPVPILLRHGDEADAQFAEGIVAPIQKLFKRSWPDFATLKSLKSRFRPILTGIKSMSAS